MKKVLIVSFHFPPDASVGAVRPAELSKHMISYGWEPTVLSVDEKYYDKLDKARYRDLPIEVARTGKIRSINDIYLVIKRFLRKLGQKPNVTHDGKEWFSEKKDTPESEGVKSKLLRYYNSLLIYLPDKETGWFIYALVKGLRLINDKNIDAVLTTSPPHSVQLIGLGLKKITKRRWVADFRDPWEIELKPRRSRTRLSDSIERWMEMMVIRNADYVISVTTAMTDRLKRLYPDFRDKMITVPNGYDSESLSKYIGLNKYQEFTITYVGSLYFGRNPLLFLTAISELINEGKIEKNKVKVRLIGDCRTSDGRSVEDMVQNIGLKDVVSFLDQVPHSTALSEIASSHLLLLMAPSQPLQIPGKVYEYIGLKSSILAVCDEGATKDLMFTYPLARVVSPDNLPDMKDAILEFYSAMHDQSKIISSDFSFDKYERRSIAKEVASLL